MHLQVYSVCMGTPSFALRDGHGSLEVCTLFYLLSVLVLNIKNLAGYDKRNARDVCKEDAQ